MRRLLGRRSLLFILIVQALAIGFVAAKPAIEIKKPKQRSLARVDEMIEWLTREQFEDGGMTWRNRRGFAADRTGFVATDPTPPEVVDTSMAALAMLRAKDGPIALRQSSLFSSAVAFVEKVAEASDASTLDLSPQKSPLLVRIGPHVDTFFALWLLAEVHDPGTPTQPDLLVQKLIAKVERNISPEGAWIDPKNPALNSPLLGHAIGVRALETALRRGFKVDPKVVALAEQYAISDAALKYEGKQAGRWKPSCGGFRPKWMMNHQLDDFEPINEAYYLSAARLSVVDQADRSNALEEKRIVDRLKSPVTTKELEKLTASLRSIAITRKTLATARGKMLTAFRDTSSFAPTIFSAEDYLSTLLTVDAMGVAKVEEWFPPTIRNMIFIQDPDGGLKSPDHISCQIGYGPFLCHRGGKGDCPCDTPCMRDAGMPSELCPMQRSFIARERVFCTAAGLAILLADTPYRKGFLDPSTVK